jgi:hypothetical protein
MTRAQSRPRRELTTTLHALLTQPSPTLEIPRLLDMVVPGFDRFLRQFYPGFRRPGTLLLPISVRIPLLAGLAEVARRPDYWAESLLGAVAETARPGLEACFRGLMAARIGAATHPRLYRRPAEVQGGDFSFIAA